MSRDFDEINPDDVEGEPEGRFLKWMSAFILLSALVGFFALAWYAYNSGTSTVEVAHEESNLELVKADSQPLKEAPSDPGGQQFPHQDKTVFNAIGGKEEEKVVENILPPSEEPLPRGGKTETWMNDKLYKKTHPQTEQVAGVSTSEPSQKEAEVPSTPFDPASVKKPAEPKSTDAKPVETKVEPVTASNVPPVEKTSEALPTEPVKETAVEPVQTVKKEEPVKEVTPEKVETKPVETTAEASVPAVEKAEPVKKVEVAKKEVAAKKPVTSKLVKAQLGAYKSEAEASQQWTSISSRFSGSLGDKQHQIIRVDLGPKGIFYRLHVSPFESAANAQAFCKTLSAKGQGCFVVGK